MIKYQALTYIISQYQGNADKFGETRYFELAFSFSLTETLNRHQTVQNHGTKM